MNPPSRKHLTGHMVVRIAQVSQALDSLTGLANLLSPQEHDRAARFRFPDDRARFVLGRGLLRKFLSQYLQQNPETIDLALTDYGRPLLARPDPLQFSISHSHDLVALALTFDARIGIDLEYVKPALDLPELAERIFSDRDLKDFQELSDHEAPAAFFRAWTRKEAYLKARGEGIAETLPQISVSLASERISRIQDAREKSAPQSWRLYELPVPAGYLGCVACDVAAKHLDCTFVRWDRGEFVSNSAADFISDPS